MSTSNKSLKGKTVVITGASSGAGRATAIEFAKQGANVVLAARGLDVLNELEQQLRESGALAIAVQTDVTDAQSVKNLAITAQRFGGKIDVWVNNAGVLAIGEFTKTPIEVHEQVIKTNLIGYINGAHAVLPYFKEQEEGILINNISVGGWMPVPYGVGYSASKFGLRGFSEALRGELLKWKNIHICDLFPAFLDTPGVQHSANYTGHVLRPAPPVYDPQRVARNIVAIANHPQQAKSIGSFATFVRLAHFFAPGISRAFTAKMVETYLHKAEPAPASSGNLFKHLDYGTSIHGGWNTKADADQRKKYGLGAAAIIALVAAGAVLLTKKNLHQ